MMQRAAVGGSAAPAYGGGRVERRTHINPERWAFHSHGGAGFTYLELLFAVATIFLIAGSLWGVLATGMPVARTVRARTALLTRAEAEMERLRGVSFAQLASFQINEPQAVGAVWVEPLSARRKRVVITLEHPNARGAPLVLVTEVHQQGLNP